MLDTGLYISIPTAFEIVFTSHASFSSMRVSLSSSLLVPADTATQSTVTSGSEPPLNFGEREVEIEIETEGKNKHKEKDSEMELEIESESDYEMDLECLGKACQKGITPLV